MERYLEILRAIVARAGMNPQILEQEHARAHSGVQARDGEDNAVDVRINGVLDEWFGLDVRAIIADLDRTKPKAIRYLIESPGGLVDDGLALYTDITSRIGEGVTVTAEARGTVASSAVLPFMAVPAAGRTMVEGSQIMVHAPWTIGILAGDEDEFAAATERALNALRTNTATYRDLVARGTSQTAAVVGAWLKTDTWFTAAEAVEKGFASGQISGQSEPRPQAVVDDAARGVLKRAALRARQSG